MLRHTLLTLPLLLCAGMAMAQTTPAPASSSGPAYLIAQFEILDAAAYGKLGNATNTVVKSLGGEFLSRRNKIVAAVGDPPKGTTIVRFPSLEKAQQFVQSTEYKALVANHTASTKHQSFIVQGGDLAPQ